jgi:hypothetical protein
MKSEAIGISRGVAEASGVARKGDRLLVVSDADAGAYYEFILAGTLGPAIQMPLASVTRQDLTGGELGVDLEAIDVLADGRIVALSERLRSLLSKSGVVFQYDDPLSELGERGLEGLAVRKHSSGGSEVAVLWEGGYVEDAEVQRQVRGRLRDTPFLPVVFTHLIAANQSGMKIKVETDDELVELKVPSPDSASDGYRFRAPDLVWHKWRTDEGVDVDGFIVLLNSQLRSPQPNKPMFGPCWLQRFDREGNPIGSHLDVDVVAKELTQNDSLSGANWEGLGWYEEGRTLVLVHDKSKKIETPVALLVDLGRFWNART